ncbi:MAG: hypothetical protein IKR81_17125 [Victivallales bacterium]|nr:hypothetical protein [Victivallales bacterium]
MNEMKPEDFIQKDDKKGVTPLWQKIFASVVFGIILLIGGLMICPSGGASKGTEVSSEEVSKNYKTLLKKKEKSFTFSSADASALITKAMNLPQQAGGDILPQNFSVQFLDDDVIKVVMSTKVYGFLPVDYCVKAKFTVASKGNVTWEVLGAKMGQVPMLFGLRDIPVENVKRQAESCSDLTKIKGKTKAAKCSGGQITIEI